MYPDFLAYQASWLYISKIVVAGADIDDANITWRDLVMQDKVCMWFVQSTESAWFWWL